MEASNVTNLLFDRLNFRAERQKVISSNIANINTPNYKTKDLVFEEELKNSQNMLSLYRTNVQHLANINGVSNLSPLNLVEIKGLQEQNDGNNVNLDSQMSEMAKNKVIFNAIEASIKKDSKLLRSIIDASAKN